MATANQPTAKPTRKVTAALVAAVVIQVANAIVAAAATSGLPGWVVGVATAVSAIGAAYMTPEAA